MKNSGDTTFVGILSDTHGRLPNAAFAALANCDYIIHAGDIGDPSILCTLKTLAPVYAVLGNNDFAEYGEDVGRFARPAIDGVRFLVAHIPQDVRIGWKAGPGLTPGDSIPQVFVHGHTHVPKIVTGKEATPAQYLICPGSVFRPRGGSRPSIAKLTIKEGRVQDTWIEEIV
ncbi:MAG: metallophosphatase family protein [Eggerthellaceae bacterium]|nr:metallophosphatase family protein [Eggerthellaceae bacterium]